MKLEQNGQRLFFPRIQQVCVFDHSFVHIARSIYFFAKSDYIYHFLFMLDGWGVSVSSDFGKNVVRSEFLTCLCYFNFDTVMNKLKWFFREYVVFVLIHSKMLSAQWRVPLCRKIPLCHFPITSESCTQFFCCFCFYGGKTKNVHLTLVLCKELIWVAWSVTCFLQETSCRENWKQKQPCILILLLACYLAQQNSQL